MSSPHTSAPDLIFFRLRLVGIYPYRGRPTFLSAPSDEIPTAGTLPPFESRSYSLLMSWVDNIESLALSGRKLFSSYFLKVSSLH